VSNDAGLLIRKRNNVHDQIIKKPFFKILLRGLLEIEEYVEEARPGVLSYNFILI